MVQTEQKQKILRRGGKNTQYKKDLHDPDNRGVITHLEPDILECEVKWALGSITMNKASGGDGIPVELSQFLKDYGVKVLHSICQQSGKLSSGHSTGKGQCSFHIYTYICVVCIYTYNTEQHRHIYYVCIYTIHKYGYMCMFTHITLNNTE